jgi:hypothetical protein
MNLSGKMYLHLQVDFLAHHKHLPSFGWWEPMKNQVQELKHWYSTFKE